MKRQMIEKQRKDIIRTIAELAVTWGCCVKQYNENASTDRIVEEIIEEAKKLEKLTKDLFNVIENGK